MFSQSYGSEQVLLSSSRHQEYSQRWGVLAHKLEKCAEALSLLKFPAALYYVGSARHDLQGLQALLQQGAKELTTVLDCYEVRVTGGGVFGKDRFRNPGFEDGFRRPFDYSMRKGQLLQGDWRLMMQNHDCET